jgi:hypothetical protein
MLVENRFEFGGEMPLNRMGHKFLISRFFVLLILAKLRFYLGKILE